MGNISFFFPKAKQGSALGVNGGLGNLGVSVMQMVAPAVIFLPMFAFIGIHGVTQEDGSTLALSNAALIWVPLLVITTLDARCELNRLMQLEDLCQKWPGDLGNPANRLPTNPPRPAQP